MSQNDQGCVKNRLEHDGTMAVAFSKECVGKKAGDLGEAEGDPVRECPWAVPARQIGWRGGHGVHPRAGVDHVRKLLAGSSFRSALALGIFGSIHRSEFRDPIEQFYSASPEQLAALVRLTADLSEAQKKLIAKLEGELDLNQRQIRAALGILGENNIPLERLAARLLEIAERFKGKRTATAKPAALPLRARASGRPTRRNVEDDVPAGRCLACGP